MERATLKTIADHTGLSVTTVSRALKNGAEVKPDTIAKVKQAAKTLGYRPNASGISLKTGKTFMLALIMPVLKPGDTVGDLGILPLIEGLTAGLNNTPYHLAVIPQVAGEPAFAPVEYVVEHGLADGVILTSTLADDDRVRYLNEKRFPFVTFGRTELATPHPWYDVDNADFTYRAAKWLYERGRRQLVLVASDAKYSFAWHRRIGFNRAAQEQGLTIDEKLQILPEGPAHTYAQFVADACSLPAPPDGYICGTEVAAIGVASSLQLAGQVVGKQVDIVSLESTSLATFFHVPLAGFRQDLRHAGAVLSGLLLRRIDGEDAEKLQVLETATFVEHNSMEFTL
ncbi:LacI family DNA-binding transcriptional regulator [Exilibacterium tricleocarpae]|uniref:LacI family DNA-binding transcriptional regulator n=1 Tax=Exilibacterium tricleocarpae TaxID=2591008 RepID=A0A545T2B1_9GAMM|nr:LacI family transcriptional regulator [Exilibacterium tricleocarpae]TQV71339.1 LacI family DNA-binding transcriptional regulator [Exilibacterium tricleocarpae]